MWFGLAAWAKQTNNLDPWERGLAFSLGRLVARQMAPSAKQASHGVRILQEAVEKGLDPDRFGPRRPDGPGRGGG